MRGALQAVAGAIVVTTALAGCSPDPPPYESRYSAPSSLSTGATNPPLPPGATFIDNFDRPDTKLGLGPGWDMRGADNGTGVLPDATDGFVRDGHYTYSGSSVVQAVRQFDGTVRRVGAVGRWTQLRPEGTETTLAMVLTGDPSLVHNIVQFTANRSSWNVAVRRGRGVYRYVAHGKFVPPLELGREYRFELEATDGSVVVRVPGEEKSSKVGTLGLLGDRAVWQQYAELPQGELAGVVFEVNTAWAAVEGGELAPVPGDN